MQKSLLLVFGAFLCFAITACTKTDVEPVDATASLNVTGLTLNSVTTPKNNIVILGGSTAWGVGASSIENSWAYKLRAKLKAVNKNDTVINLAISSYTTYHIMATGFVSPIAKRPEVDTLHNLTAALAKHPILVIISLPSNDIANGYNDEEIVNNYKAIVKKLNSEHIPYFITSCQPRNFSDFTQRIRLRHSTDLIAEAFPGHMIDYLNALGDVTWCFRPLYNSGDGIHPNDRGHELILNTIINYAPFKKVVGMK